MTDGAGQHVEGSVARQVVREMERLIDLYIFICPFGWSNVRALLAVRGASLLRMSEVVCPVTTVGIIVLAATLHTNSKTWGLQA